MWSRVLRSGKGPKVFPMSVFINTVTESEVHKILSKLKDGAPGHDGITSSCVKLIAKNIALPLTQAINKSLSQGVFPAELKIAKVIPLFKSNDASLFTNYRPISLLPIFSKIFERIMYNRLYNYLKKCNILSESQFGFREGHSTYMALLVQKMNIYGIRGNVLNWFSSYSALPNKHTPQNNSNEIPTLWFW